MPFIYLNFLGTFLLSLGIGAVSYFGVVLGKNRNAQVAMIIGFLLSCYGLYTHWVVWVDLAMNAGKQYGSSSIGITVSSTKNEELLALLMQPDLLWGIICEIAEKGIWGIKGATVSGFFLWLIWAIEAAIILAGGALAGKFAAENPFDETGNAWAKETKLKLPLCYLQDFNSLKTEMENGIYTKLMTLSTDTNLQDSHSEWIFFNSETSQQYYVSISNKKAKMNEKGEITLEDTHNLYYLEIDTKVASDFIKQYGG